MCICVYVSDAASLHCLIAQSIEEVMGADTSLYLLRYSCPYPLAITLCSNYFSGFSLSYHYSMSGTRQTRSKAWTYSTRAALFCFNSDRYHEGLHFLKNSFRYTSTMDDLTFLQFLVDTGLSNIDEYLGSLPPNSWTRAHTEIIKDRIFVIKRKFTAVAAAPPPARSFLRTWLLPLGRIFFRGNRIKPEILTNLPVEVGSVRSERSPTRHGHPSPLSPRR